VFGTLTVRVHAQARDRTQEVLGSDIGADLAAHGFTVLVGSRNLAQGETAAKSVERMPARSSST
jgi:hypothetical protein